MNPVEWMPFLGYRFFGSEAVAKMNGEALGLYVWLLWRQFTHESLPPADEIRALVPRADWHKAWPKLWPQIAGCFESGEDGRLRNQLCAEKWAEMASRVEKARENGKLGGRPRKADRNRQASEKEPTGFQTRNPTPPNSQTEIKAPNGTERNGEHATRAARAREGSDARDPDPPDSPSRMDEALRMHDALDTPEVRAALVEFEAHRESNGERAWSRQAWARNCHEWERKGPAWLIAACDTAIRAGKCTPFESSVRVNGSDPDAPTPRHLVPKSSGLLDMPRTKRGSS